MDRIKCDLCGKERVHYNTYLLIINGKAYRTCRWCMYKLFEQEDK